MTFRRTMVGLVLCALPLVCYASDPFFDHQQTTYTATHKPVSVQGETLSLTPFFSPDHSIDTLVNLIDQAETSLDIMTPSIGSWIGCSYGNGSCIGCDVEKMNGEPFPAFGALLNAVHRGVQIRLITNNYNNVVCDGMIDQVSFWTLNGIQVKWYQSTTFVHAKYAIVDGKLASISSVNWSQNSFTNNREAGILVSGSSEVTNFLQSVFEQDWSNGDEYVVTAKYTPSEMAIIQDKSSRHVVVPDGPDDRHFITPVPKAIKGSVTNFTVLTSPDYSYTTIMDMINSAQKSVSIYIYQITDQRICDAVEALHKRGIDVTLLFSYAIYSANDQAAATKCYSQLSNAGLTVNLAYQYNDYMYCHNKFWIVDGKKLGLSSGNMSPSDLPGPPMTFPTYAAGGAEWRDSNRDFHVFVEDPEVVAVYQKVIDEDLANSTKFGDDSCAKFGCGKYVPGQACQCNSGCSKYNNCCYDYTTVCK